nr:hypothetical protein [Bacillus cereus]
MVYAAFRMRPILQKMLKEEEDDEEVEVITIAVALIIICLFTPLWPVLLTFRVIKLCSKGCGTSAK